MPEPVEIRRGWHRACFDERGVTIGRKAPIAWDEIKAVGGAYTATPLLVLPHFNAVAAMLGISQPCLHLCVVGRDYIVPVPAVTLGRAWPRDVVLDSEQTTRELRRQLGEWLDRVPVVCPPGDLGFWWVGHGGWYPGYGPPRARTPEPTAHDRAQKVEHELHDLQDQLRRIQARKEHGHPPA